MPARGGERAQSIQVGAIFLFAILIIGLSFAQAYIVPNQNGQVEFDHNQQVQRDVAELRTALLDAAATGQPRSTTIRLGTNYPPRAILVNPPPPSGVLRTEDAGPVTVSNARAFDNETADYWNGSNRSFDTRWLAYAPDYSIYENAPTTRIEGSVLYNNFSQSDANLVVEPSTLVRGDDLTLTFVHGDLSTGGSHTTSVTPQLVSGPRTRVTVTRDAPGKNVTLAVPTRLSEATWKQMLADERAPEGNVVDLNVTGNTLVVELAGARNGSIVQYDLRLGAVGVGRDVDRTGNLPHYIITTEGDGTTLLEGQERNVTVAVRDRFGNPVGPGVAVNLTGPNRGNVQFPHGRQTDEDGEVLAVYEAPQNVGSTTTVPFDISIYGAEQPQSAPGSPANVTSVELTVNNRGGGPGGGGGSGPIASLNISQKNNDKYQLDASSSNGNIVRYWWDFDNDGSFEDDTRKTKILVTNPSGAEARVMVVDASNRTDNATASYP